MQVTDEPYKVLQCLNFAPDVTFEGDLADFATSRPGRDPECVCRAILLLVPPLLTPLSARFLKLVHSF